MTENELTDREIEAIRAAAAKLPLVEPARDLWPGIEARLGAQATDASSRPRGWARGIVVSTRMLAVAAALLIIATAGTTYLMLRDRMTGGETVVAANPGARPGQVGVVTSASLDVGELGAYTEEIDDLQGAVTERRSRLDPATLAVIERNLRVIDAAIEESRRALANDPNSELLTALLSQALANKVRLLRQAALLPPLT